MRPRGGGPARVEVALFAAIVIASSAACIATARGTGPVFDEPIYLNAGLEHWRSGSRHELMRLGTMPLPVDVETLPLFVWERWRGRPIDAEHEMRGILPIARAGNLLFWWVLLIYGWLAARQIAGPWAGILGATLLAGEPIMLGHASLATTDLSLAACTLAFAYHFRTGREGTWRWRVGVPTLWFAGAVLVKASGIFFAPLSMVAIEVERLWPQGGPRRIERLRAALKPMWRDMARIAGWGMLLVLVYCGCDWMPEPSFVEWAKGLPEGSVGRALMLPVAEHLRIFRNGAEPIVRQMRHNLHGQGAEGAYLLGLTGHAFWYYYPVALAIKLTLAPLVMLATLALLSARALRNWALAVAGALLLLSLASRLQIGIRLVLPLVAFLIVGLAAAIVTALRDTHGWRQRLLKAEALAAVAWVAFAALSAWPNEICYTNELWGGTTQGYLYLSDSNYDWGQGVGELERWRQSHRVKLLDVWYFGRDPQIGDSGFRSDRIEQMTFPSAEDVRNWLQGKMLAVSTTMLYGEIRSPAGLEMMNYLRTQRPVARTTTFLIFDFTRDAR